MTATADPIRSAALIRAYPSASFTSSIAAARDRHFGSSLAQSRQACRLLPRVRKRRGSCVRSSPVYSRVLPAKPPHPSAPAVWRFTCYGGVIGIIEASATGEPPARSRARRRGVDDIRCGDPRSRAARGGFMLTWPRLVRLLIAGAIVALPMRAFAQEAVVTGSVTDTTGGALPGATVVAGARIDRATRSSPSPTREACSASPCGPAPSGAGGVPRFHPDHAASSFSSARP